MNRVIEKTRPPHILGGQYESPEPRTRTRKGACLIKRISNIEILNQATKKKSWVFPKAGLDNKMTKSFF